jgi:hypothetical protein
MYTSDGPTKCRIRRGRADVNAENHQTSTRRSYARPALQAYGSMRDLTANGSADGKEGTGTGNQNRFA